MAIALILESASSASACDAWLTCSSFVEVGHDIALRDRVVRDLPAARQRNDGLVGNEAPLQARLGLEHEDERHALVKGPLRGLAERQVEANLQLPDVVPQLDESVPDLEAALILGARIRERGCTKQRRAADQPGMSPPQ